MFPEPKPWANPDEPSTAREASHPVVAELKALYEVAKVVARPANEVEGEGALRIGAALRAAYYDHTEGQSPNTQEHVEYLTAQRVPRYPSAVAAAEQSLSEDLLANDSLGG